MSRVTIKRLAKLIERRWPHLRCEVMSWTVSTDRQPRGCRYITRKGKGRTGARLIVWERSKGTPPGGALLDHKNSETYRCTWDVIDWMRSYARGRNEHFTKSWNASWDTQRTVTMEDLAGPKGTGR